MLEIATEQLVLDCLSGSEQAAAHLLDRYGKMVYGVISHLLYKHGDRDDVYQEACLRAFSGLKKLDDPARFGGWLKQITIRTAIDHIRRQRPKLEPLDERLPNLGPDPEAQAVQADERWQVQQAVGRLPEHYRQVIVLFYWSDCSYQEISQTLSIPIGTVMSRLHKAKERLRKDLERQQPAKEDAKNESRAAVASSQARD